MHLRKRNNHKNTNEVKALPNADLEQVKNVPVKPSTTKHSTSRPQKSDKFRYKAITQANNTGAHTIRNTTSKKEAKENMRHSR